MSETTTESGIVLPAGVDAPVRRPKNGSCPDCGAPNERFAPVLGGKEVCMKCGHEREGSANG